MLSIRSASVKFNSFINTLTHIVMLGLMILFGGCPAGEDFGLFINGATDLSPQQGVLVIGRSDTLHGKVTTHWPLDLHGNYRFEKFNVSGYYITIPKEVSFSAIPEWHGDYRYAEWGGPRVPSETSEWKIWLNDFIEPGVYYFRIGDHFSHGVQLRIPGEIFKLIVLLENTFHLSLSDTVGLIPGVTNSFPIGIIRPSGFSEPIQLSLRTQSGFTATFNPNPVLGSTSSMQITASENVIPGNYKLFIDGIGGEFTGSDSFIVVVSPAHAIGLSPRVVNLPKGNITTVNVSVTSPFLPATLSVVNPPAGVSFQFMPNPTSSTSTLTITAGFNAQLGLYKVPVVGTFSNGGTASDTLSITITEASGWIQVAQATDLYGMDMDEITQTGIAVGYGNTYRSIDGGRTWMMGAPVDPSNTYYSVDLLGARAVAVSNSGEVALSLDGGQTWTVTFAATSKILNGVSLSDAANGIVAGEGIIIRTRDGGSTWSIVSGVGDPYYFTDVSYRGGSAFVVGLNGTIFRATNYQDNWQQLNSGTTNNLYGVSFVNSNTGMVVGDGGTILFTSDGGASWTQRNNPNITRIDRVHMLNTTTATIGGVGGRIFQTTDAGLNWTQDVNSLNFERVSDIHLFSNNTGMCLVQDTYLVNTVTILRRE